MPDPLYRADPILERLDRLEAAALERRAIAWQAELRDLVETLVEPSANVCARVAALVQLDHRGDGRRLEAIARRLPLALDPHPSADPSPDALAARLARARSASPQARMALLERIARDALDGRGRASTVIWLAGELEEIGLEEAAALAWELRFWAALLLDRIDEARAARGRWFAADPEPLVGHEASVALARAAGEPIEELIMAGGELARGRADRTDLLVWRTRLRAELVGGRTAEIAELLEAFFARAPGSRRRNGLVASALEAGRAALAISRGQAEALSLADRLVGSGYEEHPTGGLHLLRARLRLAEGDRRGAARALERGRVLAQEREHRALLRELGAEVELAQAARALLPRPASGTELTPRELEVLAELAGSRTVEAIARLLGVSPHTVRRHIGGIYDKLDVHSRNEAAGWARSAGLRPRSATGRA